MSRREGAAVVLSGLIAGLIALLVYTAIDLDRPVAPSVNRTPPVGTVGTTWKVGRDPSTGELAWNGTDYGQNGIVINSFYLAASISPAPPAATSVPLAAVAVGGFAIGLLGGIVGVYARRRT